MVDILSTLMVASLGAIIMWSAIHISHPQKDEKGLAIGIIVVCIALLLIFSHTQSAAYKQNIARAINFAEEAAYDEGFEKGLEVGFEDGFSEGRYWACKFAEKWLTPEQLEDLVQQLRDVY